MATNSTHSFISTANGDYTTLQSWEDDIGIGLGTSTNLITDDYDHYAYLDAEQFAGVSISVTSDSTHSLYILADNVNRPGGSGTPSNTSIFDNANQPLRFDSSNFNYAVLNEVTAQQSANGMKFEGITIANDNPRINRTYTIGGILWEFRRCYIEYNVYGVRQGYSANFYNCVFRRVPGAEDTFLYDGSSYAIYMANHAGSKIYNCTFIGYGVEKDPYYSVPLPAPGGAIRDQNEFSKYPDVQNCIFLGFDHPRRSADTNGDEDSNAPASKTKYCISNVDEPYLSSNTNFITTDIVESEIICTWDFSDCRPHPKFAHGSDGVDLTSSTGNTDPYGIDISVNTPIGAIAPFDINTTHSLIASSNGDYSTLQSWEDDIGVGLGTSTDMVTDNYSHYAYIAKETIDAGSTTTTISGLTTDALHKLYIRADESTRSGGSGTPEYAALMDDANTALYFNSNYATLKFTGGYSFAFVVNVGHVEFERLQFELGPTSGCIDFNSDNYIINRCLFPIGEGNNNLHTLTNPSNALIKYCVFIHKTFKASRSFQTSSPDFKMTNCSFFQRTDLSTTNLSLFADLDASSQAYFQNLLFLLASDNVSFGFNINTASWNTNFPYPDHIFSNDSSLQTAYGASTFQMTNFVSDRIVFENEVNSTTTDFRFKGPESYLTGKGTSQSVQYGDVDFYGNLVDHNNITPGAIINPYPAVLILPVIYPNNYLRLLGSKKQSYGKYSTKDSSQVGSTIGKEITPTNISEYTHSSVWDLKDVYATASTGTWRDALFPLEREVLLYATFDSTVGDTSVNIYSGDGSVKPTIVSSGMIAVGTGTEISNNQSTMVGYETSAYSPGTATNQYWEAISSVSSNMVVGSSSPISFQFWWYNSGVVTGGFGRVLCFDGYSTSGSGIEIESSGTNASSWIFYEYSGAAGNRSSRGTYTLATNTWHHIYWAIDPTGGNSYVGINGNVTSFSNYLTSFSPTTNLMLGGNDFNNCSRGYFQELIVRKDIPYTSNFTPTTTGLL